MNYEKNYYDYIKYVKSLGKRELDYSEVHHILPRCLGGSDESDNLVVLTAREHFLAHYLLTKIYPENFKLIDAFRMMGVINKDEQKRYINSRLYESKKKFFAMARGMKVRCVETGEEFDSIKEAAKGDIQLAKRISQGCRDGGSIFGFHWEYTENKERISSKKKKVRCVETGKIYKSISEAANWKHSLRSKIAACCRGEIEEVNGYHWEYINEEAA